MKCISCGSDIPNSSTSCPFCGKSVEPIGTDVPTYDVPEQEDFNVNPLVHQEAYRESELPATPDSPVLPQDQGMENVELAPAVPVGSEVAIPPAPTMEEKKDVSVDNTVIPPTLAATSGVISNDNNSSNDMDGVRQSSSTIVEETMKKASKKKVKKIIVLVLILLILCAGGAFGYIYYTQTQTSANRINAIIDAIIKFDNNINSELTKASGKYSFGGELSASGQNIETKLSGIYAYDIEKKIMDYTFNLEQLDLNDQKLIDKDKLSVELYLADSNAYVLLQNFYDKYIYSEVQGLDTIFENINKEKVDYFKILNGAKSAFKVGLNAASKKQTVKDISIGDINTKANVISITIDTNNAQVISRVAINSIINNNDMLTELAKLDENTKVEDIKSSLEKSLEKENIDKIKMDNPINMEIYTAMFNNEFYGIRLTGTGEEKDSKIEIYKVTDGYKIVSNDGKNEVLNLTITDKKETTSSTIEETYGINFVAPINGQIVKLKFDFKLIKDRTVKAERVNTKESVKFENLTDLDKQNIVEKIKNFGNLGLLLQEYLDAFINNSNSIEYVKCSQAYNCNCVDSKCNCKYLDENNIEQSIECSTIN